MSNLEQVPKDEFTASRKEVNNAYLSELCEFLNFIKTPTNFRMAVGEGVAEPSDRLTIRMWKEKNVGSSDKEFIAIALVDCGRTGLQIGRRRTRPTWF